MPVTGPKRKPDGQAVHRHKLAHEWVEVEDEPHRGGPDLPELRSDGSVWPARTRAKWEVWRSMPHARLWSSADWDYALDCIEVAAKFHESCSVGIATELRNREKLLGTTIDARRDLRIRYVEAGQQDSADDAGVTNIADYRAL